MANTLAIDWKSNIVVCLLCSKLELAESGIVHRGSSGGCNNIIRVVLGLKVVRAL